VENIQGLIQERLAICFAKVADGLVLRNSKSSPLYSLCFAAANERGAARTYDEMPTVRMPNPAADLFPQLCN